MFLFLLCVQRISPHLPLQKVLALAAVHHVVCHTAERLLLNFCHAHPMADCPHLAAESTCACVRLRSQLASGLSVDLATDEQNL